MKFKTLLLFLIETCDENQMSSIFLFALLRFVSYWESVHWKRKTEEANMPKMSKNSITKIP